MNNIIVIICALFYLVVLFGIAYYAEHRLKKGSSIINNPYVYSLSLAVYCTAWTYYGSVGRATNDGIMFLAIYIGPTIASIFMMPVLGKIIRITKFQRINSIADFVSARYGKNLSIAFIVTLLCIIGVVPYISLQLKAISASFNILIQHQGSSTSYFNDTTFYITIVLAVFIILFGTRSVDATEKHEGLVAAIAFETIIKLVAFICAGLFITYGLFNGFGDIFYKASQSQTLSKLFVFKQADYISWFFMIICSMMAFLFLPRQFQVSVIENVDESHLKKAAWLFPLYLLIINVFVLPIAFGGELLFGKGMMDADTYVLAIPLHSGNHLLSLFIFIGGFSAATSMIIVETIAISTMVSNSMVMPFLLGIPALKKRIDISFSKDIIYIRRISILLVLLLAYLYEKNVAHYISLVSIGLVSFAAVTQFAPALIAGIYWKGASKNGALTGIIVGFIFWFYTLVIPSLANTGIIHSDLLTFGPFGLSWLNPTALFGLQGFDSISHSLFWSLFFNISSFTIVSLYSKQKSQEVYQAELFVNIYKHAVSDNEGLWKRTAYIPDLNTLLENFLGKERSKNLIMGYAQRNKIIIDEASNIADPRLVDFSEKILAGVIGSASAHIMVSSVTKEEELSIDEILKILQESQQMRELNKELRKKSLDLTRATDDLKKANNQLKDIDALKDEFLYTVTHELRTPLTSIRALSEIVHDNPDMEEEQRSEFMGRVVKETERLTHLITQVLYLERYESGKQKLNLSSFSMVELAEDAFQSIEPLAKIKNIDFKLIHPNSSLLLHADKDLLRQVMINLLGNAVKFTNEDGHIEFILTDNHDEIVVTVKDNGKGIPKVDQPFLFDKFFQARNQTVKKPEGSGLGLAISKKIVIMHGGKIWVESEEGKGSRFMFLIPNFMARNV
jgi:Na+/proline symporter/signal transduction histidine kinase